MNDQLDEGEDAQVLRPEDNEHEEAPEVFENEEVVFFEVPEDELNRPVPEIENDENIEPENAEAENENANANEIQMEPVNVDQPDDNQNDLFNEVNTLITIQSFSKIYFEAENPEPAEQWNLEELTWERMLGLDGSFVFLEHVFWVVSLNTLFILLFAYFPHQMGKVFVKRDTFIIQSLKVK